MNLCALAVATCFASPATAQTFGITDFNDLSADQLAADTGMQVTLRVERITLVCHACDGHMHASAILHRGESFADLNLDALLETMSRSCAVAQSEDLICYNAAELSGGDPRLVLREDRVNPHVATINYILRDNADLISVNIVGDELPDIADTADGILAAILAQLPIQ